MFAESRLWKCETFDANDSLRASLRTHTIGLLSQPLKETDLLGGPSALRFRAGQREKRILPEEAFPKHRIHELKDALYANVKGFQLAGVEYAKTLIASESGEAKVGIDSVGA